MACGSRDAQTLALSDDGLVWSWGDGDFGKLGRGGSEGTNKLSDNCFILFIWYQSNGLRFVSSLYDNFDVVLCLQVALCRSKLRSSTMWACDRLNAVLSSVWHLPKWVKCGRGAKVRASPRLGSNWKMLMTCD